MLFIYNKIWWLLLVFVSLTGFIQLFGYYGHGRSSKKLEYFGFVSTLVFFALTFYFVDFWGGVALIPVFILINIIITKRFVLWILDKLLSDAAKLFYNDRNTSTDKDIERVIKDLGVEKYLNTEEDLEVGDQKAKEDEQIEKINSAKTGEPITLSGYGIVDSSGKDTGKRFIQKEDAEEYMRKQNQKGFIQIPILIAIIVGILVLGGGGYFGVKQYQSYQAGKIEKEKAAQEVQQQKDLEVEQLKQEVEALKNKKPETITQTIIKEVPAQKTEDNLPAIIKQWRPIIVYIECYFLSIDARGGSGMVADLGDGSFGVFTNAHVVGGNLAPQSCKVFFPDNASATLISTHNNIAGSGQDVAVVDINNPSDYVKKITAPFANLKFCEKRPELGDEIVILGYPGIGSQTDITATEGIISGFDGDYFITSAKVEHGNSGGAAILVKDNCYFGIPSFVAIGTIESMARIFDIKKLR
jgi:hypothetical protein